ncbi:MAG: hypothetical protein QXE01_07805 [Sulfolobales archaeon]
MGEEELEIASKMVTPIYASAFFNVSLDGIRYVLIFDYIDPAGYYKRILSDKDLLKREVELVTSNMQSFLDEEEILINGGKVGAEILLADIGLRGEPSRAYISFIIEIRCRLKRGINIYENRYEREEFEYDYSAYWIFPRGSKIYEALLGGSVDIIGNIVVVKGSKGDISPGYERIRFEIR